MVTGDIRAKRRRWELEHHLADAWESIVALTGQVATMAAIPNPSDPAFAAHSDAGLLSRIAELDHLESGWVVLTDRRLARAQRLHREVCACRATTPAGVLSREAMRRQCYYDGPGAPELVAAFARDVGEIWGVHIGLRAVTKEAKAA